MSESQEIAKNYADYYRTDGDGGSIYRNRFGKYPVPMSEIVIITQILMQALVNKYPDYCQLREEKSYNHIGLEIYLGAMAIRNPNITAREVYARAIEFVLQDCRFAENPDGEINILDFGCGDGRYMEFYEALTNRLWQRGYKINVCGYEVCEEGMVEFAKSAQQKGYEFEIRDWRKFRNENLSFSLVHNPNPDAPEQIIKHKIMKAAFPDFKYRKRLEIERSRPGVDRSARFGENHPPFDLTLCMFGVMACIPTEAERIRVHKILFDLTNEGIFYTYPSQNFVDDPQMQITETNMEEGWVKYLAAGHEMKYTLFCTADENTDKTKPGFTNSFEREMMMAMVKGSLFQAADYPLVMIRRPTHCSHSIRDYIEEFHQSKRGESAPHVYRFAVAMPRIQRLTDELLDIEKVNDLLDKRDGERFPKRPYEHLEPKGGYKTRAHWLDR